MENSCQTAGAIKKRKKKHVYGIHSRIYKREADSMELTA
jgi:hypothetical protein